MPLPILQVRTEPTDADLVRLFHRTDAAWIQHLAEAEQLDSGTAYANPALPGVWNANHVRDAALAGDMTPARAVAEVVAHYARLGTRCAYWIMNPSADAAQTRPLADHLLAAGHRVRLDDILYLRRGRAQSVPDVPGLRIVPARASYRHARALAEERARERWGTAVEQLVEADILDVDDPHTDTLLALSGDRAVATIGVLAVGDLGRIENVYVAREFRRRGVGRAMLSRALEVCARSIFRHVFILVDPANAPAVGLYRSFGFEAVGQLTSYCAPGVLQGVLQHTPS
jgi:ribosomal protein S18 acetylase RimI-like enzyme